MGEQILIGAGCWSPGAVIGGAGVIGVFKQLGGPRTIAYWWYPIGLFIGAGGIAALYMRDDGPAAT